MINYLKSFIWSISILIGLTAIGTIFNYFNIINGIILKIILLLIPLISVFIGSYRLGKVSNQKGFIEGIKYGIIWILIFLIINLIISNFTFISIIYFVFFLFISILGSILGINRKKK